MNYTIPTYTDRPGPLTLTPEPWTRDALCAQIGGDEWFPEKGEPSRPAKNICRECPVAAQCLEYALRNGERHGIWGGVSVAQLRDKRRTA